LEALLALKMATDEYNIDTKCNISLKLSLATFLEVLFGIWNFLLEGKIKFGRYT
jgi:hypothetical protein